MFHLVSETTEPVAQINNPIAYKKILLSNVELEETENGFCIDTSENILMYQYKKYNNKN